MSRRLALGLALAVSAALPARAAVIVTIPSNEFVEYFGTPVTATPRDGPLFLVNTDVVPHNVVAFDTREDGTGPWCTNFDPGQCPMFWSPPAREGVTRVLGLDGVVSGRSYDFYCGVHPTMRGLLIVP